MTAAFMTLPDASAFALTNATLPAVTVEGFEAREREGLVSADLVIDGERSRQSFRLA